MDWPKVYACDFGQDNGSVLMLSTPKGNNEFYDMWKLQTNKDEKDYKMYPPEGCAPEKPTAFDRLAKQSPSTAVLVEMAQDLGYTRAENQFIRGEARTYKQKLEETEGKLVDTQNSNRYYQREAERSDDYAAELETKVAKLEKKLAPKKVAKKAKKVSKK